MAASESIDPYAGGAAVPKPREPQECSQVTPAAPLHLRVDWVPRQRAAVIRVSGVLDALTVPRFATLVDSRLRGMVGRLVLDLSDVEFLATAGLEVLAHAALQAEHRGVELSVIAGDSRSVLRAITVSGLADRLPVRRTDGF